MTSRLGQSLWRLADLPRPETGPTFSGHLAGLDLDLSGQTAWSSHGGPGRSHPARANPSLLDIPVGGPLGTLRAIVVVGIFARWAGRAYESPGTMGASIQFGDNDQSFRLNLLNGRHYRDAADLTSKQISSGDGSILRKLGEIEVEGQVCRVDALTIELPEGAAPTIVRFRDLGSPACFVVFDVALQWDAAEGCPFHSAKGGVPLSELGSVIRLRDRVRFKRAVDQLEAALLKADDLDEARGEALTFTAVATAATLELGAPRSMHRVQLEAARRLERSTNVQEVFEEAQRTLEEVVGPMFEQADTPNERMIDRALAIIDRQFARPLTDAQVADQLGLSPSHFRFLFRQATGQPFHKYLISVRLEQARRMLVEQGLSVSDVATAVGFSGLSHFSRAFTQRFEVSPTQVRNAAR